MKRRINLDRRVMLAGVGGVMAGSLLARRTLAGDLDPAPPPVGPTGLTLQQLADKVAETDVGKAECRTPVQSLPPDADSLHVISDSGSYYSTGNIQGVAGKHGLKIAADNVTVDLGGFSLFGSGIPGDLTSAIVTDKANGCVFDGTALNWHRGFNFGTASRFILWDVSAMACVDAGFVLGHGGIAYDLEVFGTPALRTLIGYKVDGNRNIVEECSACTCDTGFKVNGISNLVVINCGTDCLVSFDMGVGNAFGPVAVVAGVGDIGAVAGADHPLGNLVF